MYTWINCYADCSMLCHMVFMQSPCRLPWWGILVVIKGLRNILMNSGLYCLMGETFKNLQSMCSSLKDTGILRLVWGQWVWASGCSKASSLSTSVNLSIFGSFFDCPFSYYLNHLKVYPDPLSLPSEGGVKIKIWGIVSYRLWNYYNTYRHSLTALYYERLDIKSSGASLSSRSFLTGN